MLKTALITLIIIGLLAGVGLVWAKHNGYCTEGGHVRQMVERFAHKLDLTDEQKAKFNVLGEQLSGLRTSWRERRTAMREEIQPLLSDAVFDRERALEILKERQQVVAADARDLIVAFAEFSDSLEPEQRTRLAELIDDRLGGRWGSHHWAH